MWFFDQLVRLNAKFILMILWISKPYIRNNPDLLLMWEIREVVCRELIDNGHPIFRNKDKRK